MMISPDDPRNEEEKRVSRQFTINYNDLTNEEKDLAKTELNISACNIWGYIIELENRVKELEDRLKIVEDKLPAQALENMKK